MRSAIAVIAARTGSATSKPSCAANRAARSIRNGSSEKEISGADGVIRRRAARSARPPCGSTNVRSGSRIAIALMVKSRRTRSSSRLSPNATTGLRESAA